MINVNCECGSSFRVNDEFAGKRGKCPNCKSLIRIGAPIAEASPPARNVEQKSDLASVRNSTRCGQCGAPIPSLTYTCPFCGGHIQEAVAGNSARPEPVVLASVNQGAVDSVVSGAGKFMELLDPLGKLRREVSQVPDSPNELVTFFSKHIGGVSELHYGPIHRQACEAALTKLRVFSANDSRLTNVVLSLQAQLDSKRRAISPFMLAGILGGVAFAGLILISALAFFMLQRESSVRSEINGLIKDGQFSEARLRAEEISGESSKKSLLETIDKAENRDRQK